MNHGTMEKWPRTKHHNNMSTEPLNETQNSDLPMLARTLDQATKNPHESKPKETKKNEPVQTLESSLLNGNRKEEEWMPKQTRCVKMEKIGFLPSPRSGFAKLPPFSLASPNCHPLRCHLDFSAISRFNPFTFHFLIYSHAKRRNCPLALSFYPVGDREPAWDEWRGAREDAFLFLVALVASDITVRQDGFLPGERREAAPPRFESVQ